MKWLRSILKRIWRFFMKHGCFKFQGKNVVQDLEYVQSVYAVIKGTLIEITKKDGSIETIPNTANNIGQLVGYCYVVERRSNDDFEIVEEEIQESKDAKEKRNAWRESKKLDVSESSIKLK